VRAEYIRIGGLSSEDGYRIAVDLLELDERPTTIFATNNRMILGVLRAVNERNLKVPEDIAIVGYDEFEWASYLKPPITTVYQPTYEMGLNAAKLLFRNIQSSKMKPVRIVNLKTSLIVRESSNYKLKKGKV
jgi:LacI family transcriptional regulator